MLKAFTWKKKKKREKYSKNCRKTGEKPSLFSPQQQQFKHLSKAKLSPVPFFMRLKPAPLEKFSSKKNPKSSLEVHLPLSHGKRLCSPWVGFGSDQSCPQDIFNEHFLISLTYSTFVTPATPPGCSAGLEANQGPKAITTCPTCGSWESNTAEPGLQNSNAAWAGARWPDSVPGLALLWEWGWSPELRSEPGSRV